MAILNPAELDKLERRESQLSILAAVIVLIMAGGVALLMYPLVFVHPAEGNKLTLRFAFFGFCVLSILVVVYLLDRQRTVRHLKQQLVDELKRNLELRRQANVDLLHSIPDVNHFQDRITMEYRRAASMQRPLSILVVQVKLPEGHSDKNEELAVSGEAARAISRSLRPSDSMYGFGSGLFSVVLPDTDTENADRINTHLGETLRAVGSGNRFTFHTRLCNYPEHVKSAHELETVVLSLLPEKQTPLVGAEVS